MVSTRIWRSEREDMEKMKYIENLKEGEHVSDIYFCKQKQTLSTKMGKPYDSLILQDKTGTMDAKIWDLSSRGIYDFDAMNYVDVVGEVVSFQGALQLNVKSIQPVSEEKCDPTEYMPSTQYDIEQMYEELLIFLKKVKNTYLKQLWELFFVKSDKIIKVFKSHSAAKSVHHGFIGGLLQHTLAVVRLCDFYCDQYALLNRDLLLTAAALHDIGKIKELSAFPENSYTDEGQLLGHIVIGSEWVHDAIRQIPDFPQKLKRELQHCIIAHHGELEYGSPKKPALAEAVALNYADNTDAKLQTLTEIFNIPANMSGDWIGLNRLFESNLRLTGKWD